MKNEIVEKMGKTGEIVYMREHRPKGNITFFKILGS